MISDGGRFMVERCWGAEKTLDGARMKAEMIEYIKAYETEVAALQELIDGFEIRGDDALDTLISDWQSMPSHVTNPLDSQGIVTRNGGKVCEE